MYWLAAAGLAVAAMASLRRRGRQAEPMDRPLPPGFSAASQFRVALLGTSLTARQGWPEGLEAALAAASLRPVIMRIAGPGQAVGWGLAQVGAVLESAPDVVLIEFSINDADLLKGMSLSRSVAAHRALIAALRKARPEVRIALMTMSPAQGIRGWLRPRLATYMMSYRALAAELGIGLVDLYPRWLALPRRARGLRKDGLHPDPDVAAGVILPVLVPYLVSAGTKGSGPRPPSAPSF